MTNATLVPWRRDDARQQRLQSATAPRTVYLMALLVLTA